MEIDLGDLSAFLAVALEREHFGNGAG